MTNQKKMPVVAIAGRPNVGKSTLFNRLAGKKMAIVHDQPGVTRDYQIVDGRVERLSFKVMDTPGLERAAEETIPGRMRQQADRALNLADIILFIVDGRLGVTAEDRIFADIMRRQDRPVILCVNKCESDKSEAGYYESYQLGFEHVVPISAEHGHGMYDLADALRAVHPEFDAPKQQDDDFYNEDQPDDTDLEEDDDSAAWEDPNIPIHVAIVGRPNAGKSTLLNALVKEERAMTGEEPGITRDALAVEWEYNGRKYRLVDTAGMRKKSRIDEDLESLAVQDTLRAIRLAHVVILVTDAEGALEKQDLRIGELVEREGRTMVLALNKWDSVTNEQAVLQEMEYRIHESLPQWKGLRYTVMSALYERHLDKLMEAVEDAYVGWNKRVKTADLNSWLDHIISHHPPPLVKGRPNKIKFMTQIKARPPTFMLNVSRPKEFKDSYKRYLVNALREDFGFEGDPIRLLLKTSKNPYKDRN